MSRKLRKVDEIRKDGIWLIRDEWISIDEVIIKIILVSIGGGKIEWRIVHLYLCLYFNIRSSDFNW